MKARFSQQKPPGALIQWPGGCAVVALAPPPVAGGSRPVTIYQRTIHRGQLGWRPVARAATGFDPRYGFYGGMTPWPGGEGEAVEDQVRAAFELPPRA